MKDVLQVADHYYVLATSVLADHDSRVLKQGQTFAIFDAYGDVQPITHAESGIFHRGTRHLSRLELCMQGDQRPLLLNSTLRDDNGLLKVDLTNRDLTLADGTFFPKGTLHVHREKFLLDSKCHERVEVSNFGARDIDVDFLIRFQSDFADIFEVRGTQRLRRGTTATPARVGDQVNISYDGLDGVRRFASFRCSVPDFKFSNESECAIRFDLKIPSRGSRTFENCISFRQESETLETIGYGEGIGRVFSDHMAGRKHYCRVKTSHEQFNSWMQRSTDDLVMMTTPVGRAGSPYPYAGIPWFCAPFGRDGIITAIECLWANPALAKGVLTYLAEMQAEEHVPERDSTPGKILHEARLGEMANLREIPFGCYYGSVDSTPLFLCLGGLYLSRTNDLAFIEAIWPMFEKSLFWLDRYGDLDNDGFIEYARENPNGLVQQGWKDSVDSVFHEDGTDAEGPIALCEVQGYAYMARIEGAKIAAAVGRTDLAADLRRSAEALRERFDEQFWQDDLGTYAIALDGRKRPCRVKSSNAGQCLFTGIVKRERAPRLVEGLMRSDLFSGWGIRTISTDSVRYNPMSYHNGSIWPHDGALVAMGLAKYGYKHEVEKIFNGLFRAATYMENLRMPEVFCGFGRRDGEAPTLYPHACAPQAWAAGCIYSLVQSLLGLEIDAANRNVSFEFPRLPETIETMRINGLEVDGGAVDLEVQNYHSDVSIQVVRREPKVTVTVAK